jgi:large subunit ribosomal protein L18
MNNSVDRLKKRAYRVRAKIVKSFARPRLSVYRSGRHIYIQLIEFNRDDVTNRITSKTLFSSSTLSLRNGAANLRNKVNAQIVAMDLGKKAFDAGVTQIVFDRSGYKYHGIVANIADTLRSCKLEF